MELASRPPHPALAPHVRSLAGWHERVDGPVRRAELPGGRIVLVISFGPTLDVDGRALRSFVAGLHDAPALTEHAGEGHGIQAYLTPLGAAPARLPMGELTREVELEDLIPGDELAERLASAGWPRASTCSSGHRRTLAAPPARRARVVWQRLHARRRPSSPSGWRPRPAGTSASRCSSASSPSACWRRRRWHRSSNGRGSGCTPPTARCRSARWPTSWAGAAAISRRRSDRSWAWRPSRSPGCCASSARSQRLRAGAELADAALDSGYYDQAHFNRDFKAFAGVTPTEYRVTSVQDIQSVPA